MKTLLAAALLAGALVAAPAASAPPAAAAPAAAGGEKINQVIVYGSDPCLQSGDPNTITVCARKPERERYRIPERLRDDPNDPHNQTWTDKATQLEYVGRSGIGSCSPSGAGGMTGCFNDIVRQARAERATRDEVNWNRLIEEARQERLSKIDAAAKAADEGSPPLPAPPPPPK